MTSTRKARPASRWMGLLIGAALAAPGLGHAQIQDLVYERTVMTAADARCGLFTPEVSAALAAARAQARAAALRGGVAPVELWNVEQRARTRAAAAACGSGPIGAAAERVREGFSGYARLQRIDYPGEWRAWRADRTRLGEIRWRLAQQAQFGADRLTFGLAGRSAPGVLIAVADFADGQAPYAAQLVLRDAARSPNVLGDVRGLDRLTLDRRLPGPLAVKTVSAEARSPAGQDLRPKDSRGAWAFRFPAGAARDLAGLEPGEAVAVDFLFRGDVTRRAYVEVGDFAAGRAFLSLPAR